MSVADFRGAEGVEDWRVLGDGTRVRYRCSSLAAAVRFAAAVIDALPAGDRQPDLDLRAGSVTVRIPEHGEDSFLVPGDLEIARSVQRIAHEQGLQPDPASLRSIQIAVAHAPDVHVQAFWEAVLGYVPINPFDSRDPHEHGPRVWYHEIEHGRAGRGRTHVDVYVPRDQAEAIVEAALAAGGRIADDSRAPEWWTLASPDNHGVDVAPWPDQG